jgi:hypothetical protein
MKQNCLKMLTFFIKLFNKKYNYAEYYYSRYNYYEMLVNEYSDCLFL